jgi:putative copper export protein
MDLLYLLVGYAAGLKVIVKVVFVFCFVQKRGRFVCVLVFVVAGTNLQTYTTWNVAPQGCDRRLTRPNPQSHLRKPSVWFSSLDAAAAMTKKQTKPTTRKPKTA